MRTPTTILTAATTALSARTTSSARRTAGDRRAVVRRWTATAVGLSRGSHACNLPRASRALVNRRPQASTMPELPEVESAVRRLRARVGRKDDRARRLLHPRARAGACRRRSCARCAARESRAVERRGKHQLLRPRRRARAARALSHDRRLADRSRDDALPRFARAAIDFTDGSRVVLDDPRALSTLDLHRGERAARPRPWPRAERSRAHAGRLLARVRQAARPDQARAARSARHRRTRQHLRGGVALACARIVTATTPASSLALAPGGARCSRRIRAVIDRATGARVHRFVGRRGSRLRSRGEAVPALRGRRSRGSFRPASTYFCPGASVMSSARSRGRSAAISRQSSASSSAPLRYPVSGIVRTSG